MFARRADILWSLDIIMKAITLYIMNTGALSVYVPPGPVRSAHVSLKFTYRSLITFLGIVLVSATRHVFLTLDTLIPLSVHRPPSLVHLRGPILDPCATYVSHAHLPLARAVPPHTLCPPSPLMLVPRRSERRDGAHGADGPACRRQRSAVHDRDRGRGGARQFPLSERIGFEGRNRPLCCWGRGEPEALRSREGGEYMAYCGQCRMMLI